MLVAGAASGAEVVKVRVGNHPTYTRVVFELDAAAGYRIEKRQTGGTNEIRVTLEAGSRSLLLDKKTVMVEKLALDQSPDGAVARIQLRKTPSRVKELILSNPPRIVFDLVFPEKDLAAIRRRAEAKKAAAATPAKKTTAAKPTTPTTAVAPTPAPKTAAKPEPTPAPKTAAKPEPTPAPKTAAKPEPKAEPKTAAKPEPKAEPKTAAKPEPKPEPKTAAKPAPIAAPTTVAKPELTPAGKTPEPGKQLGVETGEELAALQQGQRPPRKRPPPPAARAPKPAKPDTRSAKPSAPPAKPTKQAASPSPAAPASGGGTNMLMWGSVAAGAFLVLVLVGLAMRRRSLPNDMDVTAVAEELDDGGAIPQDGFSMSEPLGEPSEASADTASFADSSGDPASAEPVVEAKPAEVEIAAGPGLFEEEDPEKESEGMDLENSGMEQTASEMPTQLGGGAAAAGAGDADMTRLVRDLERRMAQMETRLDETTEARERLERQVAAQAEELRVQRAAIARTQRALRSLNRPAEEQATEPALREPSS